LCCWCCFRLISPSALALFAPVFEAGRLVGSLEERVAGRLAGKWNEGTVAYIALPVLPLVLDHLVPSLDLLGFLSLSVALLLVLLRFLSLEVGKLGLPVWRAYFVQLRLHDLWEDWLQIASWLTYLFSISSAHFLPRR